MSSITLTREINAPVDDVFALASNFPNAAETIRGIDRVQMLTAGPVGVGTRFRETRKLYGKEATEEMEVTLYEPPKRYVIEAESHGAKYHTEFRFEERGMVTEVTMTFGATPLTFVAKVMAFLTKPLMKVMVETCGKDLDDIKAAAEAAAGNA